MSVITIGIRRTRRRRRRGKANHFCVCPHKNAKAAASVFATDDHCSNNDKSELRQKCVRVCVLMRSPNNLLSSFSSCMHFFSSSTKILLFFSLSLSHLSSSSSTNKNKKRTEENWRGGCSCSPCSSLGKSFYSSFSAWSSSLSLCLSH